MLTTTDESAEHGVCDSRTGDGGETADLDPAACSPAFLRLISRDFARDHSVISQGRVSQDHAPEVEVLAIAPHTPPLVAHNIGVRLGCRVCRRLADPAALIATIDQAYETQARQQGDNEADAVARRIHIDDAVDEDLDSLLQRADRDLLSAAGKAPVVRLVDSLLFRAVQRQASDLHLQPLADRVVIRQRVDGVLDDGHEVPRSLLRPLVSRIKVMARMDVAERLVPQDGRATVRIGDRAIDLRVSSLPTAHGERVVIRLLDTGNQLCDFTQLGMPPDIAAPFLNAARRVNGILLVTGPTGSGKTTTLYATLRELNARERNIMTIEDPIEYELDILGLPISQSQVNAKKGVNFANGLRHILRQDPDIIMVGEIRDAETARIAIQSSLTGHLVLSTLHTNDAASAVTRLLDLGVEPYLVSASLSGVLAQRLVRTCCAACGGPGHDATPSCPQCDGSGYHGRTGVFELLLMDDGLRRLVAHGAGVDALRQQAQANGMTPLAAAGQRLIDSGRTSTVEIERVIHG